MPISVHILEATLAIKLIILKLIIFYYGIEIVKRIAIFFTKNVLKHFEIFKMI